MSPQKASGGQKPQSAVQLFWFSPHSGWQMPSPQNTSGGHAQSLQVPGFSPHWGWQMPSPQNSVGLQPEQSWGQVVPFSLHPGWQKPSPQKSSKAQEPQSSGQVAMVSPQASWHLSSPHEQPPPCPPPPSPMGTSSICERPQPMRVRAAVRKVKIQSRSAREAINTPEGSIVHGDGAAGKRPAGLAEGVAQFLARCPRCLYRHGGMNPVRATMSYSDPGADPFAAVVGSHKGRAKPEWCVDFGVVLEAMTTFELWNAIERGDVTVRARVWREGLECWTPVDRLPELSLAVARSPSPSEVRLSGPRAEAPSLRAERISLPPESSPRSQDLPTLPAAPKALASDPRVEQAARMEQSAQSERRARVEPRDSVSPAVRRWGSFRARGGHWIALGASVGALSTAIALARTSPAEPPGRAVDAQSAVMLEGVEHERGRGVDEEDEAQRSAEAWDTPAAAGAAARHRPTARARHDERGQRRLPRDGRSAR